MLSLKFFKIYFFSLQMTFQERLLSVVGALYVLEWGVLSGGKGSLFLGEAFLGCPSPMGPRTQVTVRREGPAAVHPECLLHPPELKLSHSRQSKAACIPKMRMSFFTYYQTLFLYYCNSENCHQHTDFQMSRLFAVTVIDKAPGELDQRLEAAHRFNFVPRFFCNDLFSEKTIDFEKQNSGKP